MRPSSYLTIIPFVWYLIKVDSEQTYPHVSFKGRTLVNNSYVNIEQVGHFVNGNDSVRCLTDLNSCCNGSLFHRGDWYFPNGTRLPFGGEGGDILESRGKQVIDLRRKGTANSPAGIYRCDASTIAVHSDSDKSVKASVYVGLYATDGGYKLHIIIIYI